MSVECWIFQFRLVNEMEVTSPELFCVNGAFAFILGEQSSAFDSPSSIYIADERRLECSYFTV